MVDTVTHHHHDAIAKRLKRAGGHLTKVIRMMEEEAPCVDVATQLHAVYKAIGNAKQALIHDHIDHCLAGEGGDQTIDEIKRDLAAISKLL